MKKQILLILMLVLLAGGYVLRADDIVNSKGAVIAQTLESHYDYGHFDINVLTAASEGIEFGIDACGIAPDYTFDPNGDDLSFLWQEPEPTDIQISGGGIEITINRRNSDPNIYYTGPAEIEKLIFAIWQAFNMGSDFTGKVIIKEQ